MAKLPQRDKDIFQALCLAVATNDVFIMDCFDTLTGKPVAIVCVQAHHPDGHIDIAPVAKILSIPELEALRPPSPEGGYDMNKAAQPVGIPKARA